MSNIQKAMPPLPSNEKIICQLNLLLSSSDFKATPQQVAFLKFVVEHTVGGKASEINGYLIATRVLGRGSDFDQSKDSIVSVQAMGLRRALAQYYETAGENDLIRIDIPKGSFVPIFQKRPQTRSAGTARGGMVSDISGRRYWAFVLIMPLRNLSGDPELNSWGIRLATALADELNRYPDIRVMTLCSGNSNAYANKHTVLFVIDGSVRSDGKSIKIILNLKDTNNGHQVWSDSHRSAIEAVNTVAFQEQAAKIIAAKVAFKYDYIAKAFAP